MVYGNLLPAGRAHSMQITLRWTPRKNKHRTEDPDLQLRHLLQAARRTPFYSSPHLEPVVSVADFDLTALPSVPLDDYLEDREYFRDACHTADTSSTLLYPLDVMPRTALVMSGFRSGGSVRVFANGWKEAIEKFQPAAIAASVRQLRELAFRVQSGSVTLPLRRDAVIALTRIGEDLLTEEDRDLFWRVFEAPVFQQYLGFHGELLAAECEAHQDLHVKTGNAIFETENTQLLVTCLRNLEYPVLRLGTGLTADLIESLCPCGQRGLRLANVGAFETAPLVMRAAAGD